MRHLIHACCATLALAATVASAQPWKKPVKAAADAVEDAYDRTQRSNGRCRNQVGPPLNGLVDRLDDLEKMPAPFDELHQLRFELATLAQQAPYAACPIGVTEDLQRALDILEDARVSVWSDPERGKKNRRDKRKGDLGGQQSLFVQLSPIKVTLGVPFQNEQAVQLSLPEVRFEGLQGQGFYVATRFRSFEGDWSNWVTTQVWTVPSSPFVWRNGYNHVLRYSTLAEEDFSNGRFIAHIAVFGSQGQELAFREVAFRVPFAPPVPVVVAPPPPPVPPRRDCGTGLDDPGCLMLRDGQFAMDAATYQGFAQAMRNNRSDMFRMDVVNSMLAGRYLTAAQFGPLLDLYMSEMYRLDFAERAAPRIVNPQHAIGFASKFRSSMYANKYTKVMARQPAGTPWQPGMLGPNGIVIQAPGVVVAPGTVVAPGVVVAPGQPVPAVVQPTPGVVVQVPGMTVTTGMPVPPPPPGYVQPVPAVAVAVRDCGTGANDPGCQMTRNGFIAMDAVTFQGMLTSLRSVMNEITREEMFEKLITRHGLTALQLSAALDLFNNEITRLDIAKTAASHVVNPQHALSLSTKFGNSFSAQEFVEVYADQH